MLKKYFIVFIAGVFFSNGLFAQDTIRYFNENDVICSKGDAVWTEHTTAVDAEKRIYYVTQVWNNGKEKLTGSYIYNLSGFKTGKFIEYYNTGKPKSEGNYFSDYQESIQSRQIGKWEYWFPNGQKQAELFYHGDENIKVTTPEVLNCWDSTGNSLVKSGEGIYSYVKIEKLLSLTKYVTYQGAIVKGRFEGEWSGKFEDGIIYVKNTYSNGLLLRREFVNPEPGDSKTVETYDQNGRIKHGEIRDANGDLHIYQDRFIKAYYPGGESALYNLISKNMHYPSYEWTKGIEGTVTVSFIVAGDGKIVNAKIVNSVSSGLDQEALRLVYILHKYKAARLYGEQVGTSVEIPIDFKLPKMASK